MLVLSVTFVSLLLVVVKDGKDVVLAVEEVGLGVQLDLDAAVLRKEDVVANLDQGLDGLALLVAEAGADGDDGGLRRRERGVMCTMEEREIRRC